jgi:protoheme IX farnesyltransferase
MNARAHIDAYLELAKARLSALVLLTTLVGYLLASRGDQVLSHLLWTLLGTALAAGGANALNQWLEVEQDSLMERTRKRPLPSGRLTRRHAMFWGLGVAGTGVALLLALVGRLPAALAASVILLYTLVYTPLKRRSTLCTLVGAVCGAIPPMIGWSAATGGLELGAWLLAATLFVWQVPHFFALAWIYRRDYARAGYRMLPVVDPEGRATFPSLLLFSLALLPLGLNVFLTGLAGPIYAAGSLLAGGFWSWFGFQLYREHSDRRARRVFLGSLLYLPLVLGLMVADRGPLAETSFSSYLAGGPAQAVTPVPSQAGEPSTAAPATRLHPAHSGPAPAGLAP